MKVKDVIKILEEIDENIEIMWGVKEFGQYYEMPLCVSLFHDLDNGNHLLVSMRADECNIGN